MYLAALKAFFSCSLVCVVVECSSDIKICSHRLEPVEGLPISACGNPAYARPYLGHKSSTIACVLWRCYIGF